MIIDLLFETSEKSGNFDWPGEWEHCATLITPLEEACWLFLNTNHVVWTIVKTNKTPKTSLWAGTTN